MLKTYQGLCHCGAVRFEAKIDLSQSTYRCNCSICRRTRFWPAIVKPEGFRLLAGQDELTRYLFNTKKNHGVNVMCLEGVTEEELSRVPITYVDGLNDRWQDAPAFFAHL